MRARRRGTTGLWSATSGDQGSKRTAQLPWSMSSLMSESTFLITRRHISRMTSMLAWLGTPLIMEWLKSGRCRLTVLVSCAVYRTWLTHTIHARTVPPDSTWLGYRGPRCPSSACASRRMPAYLDQWRARLGRVSAAPPVEQHTYRNKGALARSSSSRPCAPSADRSSI